MRVIYVEYHDGPEQTEAGWIDWLPGWYARCDECGWTAGPAGAKPMPTPPPTLTTWRWGR
jgi:hypothetical protein